MDGNDKLESLLQNVIGSTEALKKLGAETGRVAPTAGSGSESDTGTGQEE